MLAVSGREVKMRRIKIIIYRVGESRVEKKNWNSQHQFSFSRSWKYKKYEEVELSHILHSIIIITSGRWWMEKVIYKITSRRTTDTTWYSFFVHPKNFQKTFDSYNQRKFQIPATSEQVSSWEISVFSNQISMMLRCIFENINQSQ